MKRDIYPLTIVSDRYHGSYSGANFLAFQLDHDSIPLAIGGGDSEEMYFWETNQHEDFIIGKGNTVQEAFDDLYNKINN